MVGVVLSGPSARSTYTRQTKRRGVAALCLFLVCSPVSPLSVAEAKPQKVNFEGLAIPVESQASLGGGTVAIRFEGEDFVTAAAQAGRSVATRLVRRPDLPESLQALVVQIVEHGIKRGDSQLLAEAINARLSRDTGPQDVSAEIWKLLLSSPLGRTLMAEGLRRRRDAFSVSLCHATLISSEQGISTELSESVANRCLDSEVERILAELSSGQHPENLANRAREAVSAFGAANADTLKNSRLFERHLRSLEETLAIDNYFEAREYLSRRLSEGSEAHEKRRALAWLDDAFLNRLSETGNNSQALLFLMEAPFESRTQRTHQLVAHILRALHSDEYGALRRRPILEAMSRFANHDSEIASIFGDVMGRVVSDAGAKGLSKELIQIAMWLQDFSDSVKRSVDPAMASAVGELVTRGDHKGAEELRRSWARPLPVSLRFRWWIADNRLVLYVSGLFALGFLIARSRWARVKRLVSGGDRPTPVARSWPGGYEESLRQVGLAPGVSLAEIKQAYRAAVKREHPDLKPNATPEDQEKIRQIVKSFERIMELHQSLQ